MTSRTGWPHCCDLQSRGVEPCCVQVLGELIDQEGIIVYQGARYKPLPAIAQVEHLPLLLNSCPDMYTHCDPTDCRIAWHPRHVVLRWCQAIVVAGSPYA